MGVNGFTWNRACAIKNLDDTEIHATFFKVSEMGLVPFEFAEGPSPVAGSEITVEFLSELATYLIGNRLTDLMALEVGNFAISQAKTAELDIQWGTAESFTVVIPFFVLPDELADLVPTGWNVTRSGVGEVPCAPNREPDAGTTWAAVIKPKNTHKVFVNSTSRVTPGLLTTKLVDMGIINV